MSSNSTASAGSCNNARTLLGVATASFFLCLLLALVFLFLRLLLLFRRRPINKQVGGLDAAAIASIPSFPFRRAAAGAAAAEEAEECAVCLHALDEGQMVRRIPGCGHVFHRECVDLWLASRASCPVCRGKPDLVVVPVGGVASGDVVMVSSSTTPPGGTDETTACRRSDQLQQA